MPQVPKNKHFELSPAKNKKYRVYFTLGSDEYYLDFGQIGYEQYRDATPLRAYAQDDHRDPRRRANYLARAGGIVDKHGRKTKDNPLSPNYWSIRYLW